MDNEIELNNYTVLIYINKYFFLTWIWLEVLWEYILLIENIFKKYEYPTIIINKICDQLKMKHSVYFGAGLKYSFIFSCKLSIIFLTDLYFFKINCHY